MTTFPLCMILHKITTTMKFAIFLLSLNYALLGTHHARTLTGDVIQMVIEAIEFQSLDRTNYGRVPRTPPSPSVAPSRGQDTFGQDKPNSPPTPSVAPARGEGTYGRVKPKPKSPPTPSEAPARGEGTYGRVKPKTPPSPSVAPSRGQATYGGNNPNPKDTNEPTGDVIVMITGKQEFQSLDQTTYGRVRKTPPPPSLAPSIGLETLGRRPKSPPTPSGAPSRGQGTYGRENPSSDSQTTNELTDFQAAPSLKQNRFRDEATCVRDNFITTQPSYDLTRVAPIAPTPPEPNVPSHPTTSKSLCFDSGNMCSGLSTSV